jgi:renalase
MTSNKPSVAVIGAGLAGITCARQLQSSGYQVFVYEKSRGASGRMSTRRDGEWFADHGAQYFTAKSPEFQAQVEQWRQDQMVEIWNSRIAERLEGSPSQFRIKTGITRFVAVPGMNSLVRQMSQALSLQINTTIVRIERTANGWIPYCKESTEPLPLVQSVIFAIPAPQLLAFSNVLPLAWHRLVEQTQFNPCWASLLGFDRPLDLPFDGLFINSGPLRWIARNHSKPGRSGPETWTLHASPEFSQETIEDDKDQIQSVLQAAFAELSPTQPVWTQTHKWRYALATQSDNSPPYSLWSKMDQLGVCGDWLADGRVEGAWQSGRHCAESVLA